VGSRIHTTCSALPRRPTATLHPHRAPRCSGYTLHLEEQTLKPGFHCITARVETERLQAMGQATGTNVYTAPPREPPSPARFSGTSGI
jgi:hypothetical protein